SVEVQGEVPAGVFLNVWVNGAQRAQGRTLPLVLTLPAGTHQLEVRARSGRGNPTVVARGAVVVDDAPPRVLDFQVRPVREGMVQVEATLRLSGIGRVTQELWLNGRALPGELPRTVALNPGVNNFLLRVRDEGGRQHEVSHRSTYLAPPPAPPPPLPGQWGIASLPTHSGTLVEVQGTLKHNGLSVLVREAGRKLGESKGLPFLVRVEPGERVLEVVAVDASGRQQVLLQKSVVISDLPPQIRSLKLTADGHDRVRVGIDVLERGQGKVQLTVEHNGRAANHALPLKLSPGYNLIYVAVKDDAGRVDDRAAIVRFFPATQTSGPMIRQGGESGLPSEARALRQFYAGDYRGALGLLDNLLRAQRSPVDLYALRAAAHLGLAQQFQDLQRQQQLNEALTAATSAILNASQSVRSDHYELRARIQDALGRPSQAEQDRNQANRLR
ncbi:MAG: hypothetical protein KDD82_30705, partial [Planctomycetes bacterium]|nr:hypothetical protein [Planctomycetota bacterium]